ncbi:hypothetical protein BSQ36_06930 [Pediococcus damnosus]|nr:hypothetical protein BSQ36_06930 [Pediococcus damnosus]
MILDSIQDRLQNRNNFLIKINIIKNTIYLYNKLLVILLKKAHNKCVLKQCFNPWGDKYE